jgi:hypothetical protein
MMSADPFVPDPLNAQAWNRYSYVINNPLAFTDPNGYCFLGMCSWGKAVLQPGVQRAAPRAVRRRHDQRYLHLLQQAAVDSGGDHSRYG